jgi:hypothetical protein
MYRERRARCWAGVGGLGVVDTPSILATYPWVTVVIQGRMAYLAGVPGVTCFMKSTQVRTCPADRQRRPVTHTPLRVGMGELGATIEYHTQAVAKQSNGISTGVFSYSFFLPLVWCWWRAWGVYLARVNVGAYDVLAVGLRVPRQAQHHRVLAAVDAPLCALPAKSPLRSHTRAGLGAGLCAVGTAGTYGRAAAEGGGRGSTRAVLTCSFITSK